MATERADDLKALMHDNSTFIQFPPIGSSTSLISVFGDHRVNIQRTIRSIMQHVRCLQCQACAWTQPFAIGMSILRRFSLAITCAVQRDATIYVVEPYAGCDNPKAGLLHQRCRSRI